MQRKRGAAAGDFYPTDLVEEITKNLPTIHFPSLRKTEEHQQTRRQAVHFRISEAAHIRFVQTGSLEEAWNAGKELCKQ